RKAGLPALAINWGPWSAVGLAAKADRGARLAEMGLGSITPAEGVEAFGRLLRNPNAQVSVMPFDIERWQNRAATWDPLFDEMRSCRRANDGEGQKRQRGLTREALAGASPGTRGKLLQEYLNALISRVLGFEEPVLCNLDVSRPIGRLGVDSLMAVEMKSRVDADLGITIPIADFLRGGTIATLTATMLDQLAEADPITTSIMIGAEFGLAGTQWEELSI